MHGGTSTVCRHCAYTMVVPVCYNKAVRKTATHKHKPREVAPMKNIVYFCINIALHLDRLHGRNPNFAVR